MHCPSSVEMDKLSQRNSGKSLVDNLACTSATAGLPHEADLPLPLTEVLLFQVFQEILYEDDSF